MRSRGGLVAGSGNVISSVSLILFLSFILHSPLSHLGEDYRLMNERFQVPKTAILCRKWLLFSRIDTELADGGGEGRGAAAGDGDTGASVEKGDEGARAGADELFDGA